MPNVVTVDVKEVQEGLRLLALALSPLSLEDFLKAPVVGYLHQAAETRFQGSGDAASGRWPQLAPYTIADRVAHGFAPGPPMIRGGDLHAFLTGSPGDSGWSDDGAALTFPSAADGPLEAKLKMAQEGINPNPRPGFGPVPPRPVAALAPRDAAEITALLSVWIQGRMRAGI